MLQLTDEQRVKLLKHFINLINESSIPWIYDNPDLDNNIAVYRYQLDKANFLEIKYQILPDELADIIWFRADIIGFITLRLNDVIISSYDDSVRTNDIDFLKEETTSLNDITDEVKLLLLLVGSIKNRVPFNENDTKKLINEILAL